MDERAWLARYLALAVMLVGGLEWLLGRVVSRLAAAPPIEGMPRTIIETLGRFGFFLLSTAFLLAVSLLFLSALQFGERAYSQRRAADMALAFYLCIFGVFALSHTLLALMSPSGEQAWLNVTFNMLSALGIWWLAFRFAIGEAPWAARGAVLLVALAYTGWYWAVLFTIKGVPGNAFFLDRPADALRLGELAAVLVPVAFFLAVAVPQARWHNWKRWIAPVVVGLLFSAGNIADIIADQGFTGVFSIWSVGFTLYLPWPLYALSLVLYLYTVLTCFSKGQQPSRYGDANVGMGLLLLPFAGYYLQLTYQHLLALLALLLLTGIARPLSMSRVSRRELIEQATT
jgi:hypothetical protein